MRGRLLAAEVKRFNELYPPGTQVRYWPGERAGAGLVGYTDSTAFVAELHQRAVVFVRGLRSSRRFWVPLSRVQPLVEQVPGGWFPQQVDGTRQTVDRDGKTEELHEACVCPDCEGLGEVRKRANIAPCGTCQGQGEWCAACGKPASACPAREERA